MSAVKLYDNIYMTLANDDTILGLMDIAGADPLTKALHIQKRANPQGLADNLPMISFYSPDGGRESGNSEVYNAIFVFDVYTNDDVDVAQQISDRIYDIFDNNILPWEGIENFSCTFLKSYESSVNTPNVYCFTTIVSMSIALNS